MTTRLEDDDGGAAFKARCAQAKQHLHEKNKSSVRRSMREWERKQFAEKACTRAARLLQLKEANTTQIRDLALGEQAYNVKSIRQASMQGDIERLHELLLAGFSPDASSAMGLTPLLGATQSDCLDAVTLLLRYGANVNHQHVTTKRTALMEASSRANLPIIKALLRYGAKLELYDAQGDTVFDCVRCEPVQHVLRMSTESWQLENADLFPAPFRCAALALFAISKRQLVDHKQSKTAARKELALRRARISRMVAEAKVKYDDDIRAARTNVTLLKRLVAQDEADDRFDCERARIAGILQDAWDFRQCAEQPRYLTREMVMHILSFCARHWFDRSEPCIGSIQKRSRGTNVVSIAPTKLRVPLATAPLHVCEEEEASRQILQEKRANLAVLIAQEHADVHRGVARDSEGRSLASLRILIIQAEHLPYRDPRTKEPMDPFVRVFLQTDDVTDEGSMQQTGSRLADRCPEWNEQLNVSNVECVGSVVRIQVVDAKRGEVGGELSMALRSLLDQKQHETWSVLPPTLRQQALEKHGRAHPARLRIRIQFIHTPSLLLTREIRQLCKDRDAILHKKRNQMQHMMDGYLQQLDKI